jgi:type II secretory pathway component PulF
MDVFEYSAVSTKNEGHTETGRVVARDQLDAYDKLRRLGLTDIRLKRLHGFSALVARLTADVH